MGGVKNRPDTHRALKTFRTGLAAGVYGFIGIERCPGGVIRSLYSRSVSVVGRTRTHGEGAPTPTGQWAGLSGNGVRSDWGKRQPFHIQNGLGGCQSCSLDQTFVSFYEYDAVGNRFVRLRGTRRYIEGEVSLALRNFRNGVARGKRYFAAVFVNDNAFDSIRDLTLRFVSG